MAMLINRHTKAIVNSGNTPDYPLVDWIVNPNLNAVEGLPVKYWKIVANSVMPMNLEERSVVDAEELATNMPIILQTKLLRCMDFGRRLMAEFGAENMLLGYDDMKMMSTAVSLKTVQELLNSGSLKLAKAAIAAIPNSELIPLERKNRYVAKIDNFLADL